MENKRRKVTQVESLETAQPGFANGMSLQLKALIDAGEHRSLADEEKWNIILKAEKKSFASSNKSLSTKYFII
jgi:hypothetical protein